MPVPLIWLGGGVVAWLILRETDDVLAAGAKVAKWAVIGGAVYVAGKAAKVI